MNNKKISTHKKKSVKNTPKQPATSLSPWQIAVVAGVVLLVAGVLWLKGRPVASEATVASPPTLATPTGAGVAAAPEAVVVEPATAEVAAPTGSGIQADLSQRAGEPVEGYLDRLLAEGQPIFAFFHSYTCAQCVEMDKIVQLVYPDFVGQVALVDVNVYDEANTSLLQRAGIRVIPTLIFIDRTGQGEGTTGVMPEAQLRERLAALAAGGQP